MEHSTSPPSERVLRVTQLAKLSFNHPSVVLTADVFQYFKNISYTWYIYNITKKCSAAPKNGMSLLSLDVEYLWLDGGMGFADYRTLNLV